MTELKISKNCQACGTECFDTDLNTIKLSGLESAISVCESCVSKNEVATSFKDAAGIISDIISIAKSSNNPERRIRAIKALIGE